VVTACCRVRWGRRRGGADQRRRGIRGWGHNSSGRVQRGWGWREGTGGGEQRGERREEGVKGES
jgi:hypothetical protein